jgi:hypothetical protein
MRQHPLHAVGANSFVAITNAFGENVNVHSSWNQSVLNQQEVIAAGAGFHE